MEFTGERFIPGDVNDTEMKIEHLQRYYSLNDIVRGKIVLDAACGEGYGSMSLAENALRVIGIDISEEAICSARNKYNRDNLEFICASIDKIPLKDKSVDIVVSFETIEHVDLKTQLSFLSEISRVLKPNGILVISTPNRKIYTELFNYNNAYHVKEFDRNEFELFLHKYFKNVKMFSQRFEVVSLLNYGDEKYINVIDMNRAADNCKYMIAVCCNSMIKVSLNSIVYEYGNQYLSLNKRIVETQNEIEKLGAWGHKLDDEVLKKDQLIQSQNARIEKLGAWGHKLDKEISKRDNVILSQNARIEELGVWGHKLDKEISKRDNVILSQNARIEELGAWGHKLDEEISKKDRFTLSQNERIEELSAWGRELENQILSKDALVNDLSKDLSNAKDEINEKTAFTKYLEDENIKLKLIMESIRKSHEEQLSTIDGCKQALYEKENELNNIYRSRGWRYLLKLYKMEDVILPLHSRRRETLKSIYFLMKNSRLIIKHINKENLKRLYTYSKAESPSRVFNHIKSYFGRYKPIPKMDLKLYEADGNFERINFKCSSDPLVSIIIPVYNQWEYTYSCLRSIYENTKGIEYEIIIADDVSNDETVNISKYIENVKVIRNDNNLGFLLNCNNAAKYAKGKYILFLNNDTNVQEDWLKYLVELIERDNKIGMVGSKFIYADGRLQEAGGIVWKDASGWNYGRFNDPEMPEYNYVKEVDYISGAGIMIRTVLWNLIGGFDKRYIPAYYEDSDLAFEVRKRGYKVMYQPKSVIVHFEGISNGTDLNAGLKSYQVANQNKFYDKWKNVLEAEHFPNGEKVFLARDRSSRQKHILVVDHYVPHHDKDAGGKCTFMYLNLFVKLGLKVTFIGDNYYPHEPYTTELKQLGIEVLYGDYYYMNWEKWVKENGHYFDYVYLNRPHISIKYIDLIRENSDAKIIYFGHDLHYLREQRAYELTGDKRLLESAEEWKKKEFELFNKADIIHVVGSYEQSILVKEFPNKPIRNIPVYFYDDVKYTGPLQFSKRNGIMFVGGFGHAPNGDAVLWFAEKVFPAILKEYPNLRWYIIGSNPPKEVLDLASDNIIVTGFVSDEELAGYYNSCRMSVVPLRYGAGVKGKVIESIYNRIPLITTSIGAEGLSLTEDAFIVADTAEEFAKKIIDYYDNFEMLGKLTENCKPFILNNFTKEKAIEIIKVDIDC